MSAGQWFSIGALVSILFVLCATNLAALARLAVLHERSMRREQQALVRWSYSVARERHGSRRSGRLVRSLQRAVRALQPPPRAPGGHARSNVPSPRVATAGIAPKVGLDPDAVPTVLSPAYAPDGRLEPLCLRHGLPLDLSARRRTPVYTAEILLPCVKCGVPTHSRFEA